MATNMNKIYLKQIQRPFLIEQRIHKALNIISLTFLVGFVTLALL